MKLKAGTYWVGDLCYLIEDQKDWDQVVKFMFGDDGNKPKYGVFKLKGAEGAIFGTAYGDGVYHDQLGNEYGVDSGTLGLFPVGVLPNSRFASGGSIHLFPNEFHVSCVRGEMRFGHISIDTRD